jgi:hypothetical protein
MSDLQQAGDPVPAGDRAGVADGVHEVCPPGAECAQSVGEKPVICPLGPDDKVCALDDVGHQRATQAYGVHVHADRADLDPSKTMFWDDDYAAMGLGNSPGPVAAAASAPVPLPVKAEKERRSAAELFSKAYAGLEQYIGEYEQLIAEQKSELFERGIPPSKARTPQGQMVMLPYLMPLLEARTALLHAATVQLEVVS